MFYDGKLIHCHKLKPGGPHHIPPLVFHNVMGQERQQEDSPSFYNKEEIDAVFEEVGVNPFCLYIQGRNGFLQSGWYSLDAHTSTKGCICDFPQVVVLKLEQETEERNKSRWSRWSPTGLLWQT